MKIAKKQMNNASAWKKIYQLNQKTIENAARKHGRKSSSNGAYIYAGTVLKLPGGSS
jgi:nucleoid-associated protein YgaU